MKSTRDRSRVRRAWLRIGLLIVAVTPLASGLWALLFPRAFYDDFPLPGSDWVSTLGPYNEHLVRDYGALNLAMAVLLLAAGVLLERRLAQVALITWLVFEVPHSVFHAGQTHHFSAGSNLAQLSGLALLVVLPLVVLFLLPRGAADRDPGHADINRMERIRTR
jgi:type IV secretory pathway TraG/TraD family ATPase VirD4